MSQPNLKGFYLFESVLEPDFQDKLITIIENDPRFLRYMKTGKLFYQMTKEDFPEEWIILQGVISSLHESCIDFDIPKSISSHQN